MSFWLYSSSLWGSLWGGRGRTLPLYRPFLPRKSWRKSRTSSSPTWNHATSNPNLRSKDSSPSHRWHHCLCPSNDWWTIYDITSCIRQWLLYKPYPLALIVDVFQNCVTDHKNFNLQSWYFLSPCSNFSIWILEVQSSDLVNEIFVNWFTLIY